MAMSYSNPDEIVAEELNGGSSKWPIAGLRRAREVFSNADAMSEERWAWIGAIAGVVFVLTLLVSKLMIPNPPAIDSSVSVVMTYFSTYAGPLITSGVISTAG